MAAVDSLDWPEIAQAFGDDGYDVLPPLLSINGWARLIALEPDYSHFRIRIDMARYRFDIGRYAYFADPIPTVVSALRQALYSRLAQITNGMTEMLGCEVRYPATLDLFLKCCAEARQSNPSQRHYYYAMSPGGITDCIKTFMATWCFQFGRQ